MKGERDEFYQDEEMLRNMKMLSALRLKFHSGFADTDLSFKALHHIHYGSVT